MKVLVTGASGLLGRAVYSAFEQAGHEVTGTAFTRASGNLVKIDLQDESALKDLLEGIKPDVVVHCAAERRPDVAEQNPDQVQKLNVALPAHLSTLSLSPIHPFFLIFISTDYVFPGNAPSPPTGYEPQDPVAPTNLYGRTKEEGERAVLKGREAGGKSAVLRVPVLYGDVTENSESAVNILLDITRRGAAGARITMDHWAIRYPTNVSDVARVIVDISTLSQTTEIAPILHFSTQHPYTKYEICLLLAKLHSPPLEFASEENMRPASEGPKEGETVRPRDCHLVNTELEKSGIDVRGVDFETWWRDWLKNEKL